MFQDISIFFIVEMIGTAAFASSGAMVAIKKELDLLGVIVLGEITAVGGGMLRDILLGKVPPTLFVQPVYVLAGLATVLILFGVVRLNQGILEGRSIERYERVMNFFDAVGLGAFTVTGINTAMTAGYGDYHFLAAFLGVLTGVGGGMLRDIMADQTPYILRKHFYACASIMGAVCYLFLLGKGLKDTAVVASACLVVAVRMLAAKFCWNLPKATRGGRGEA